MNKKLSSNLLLAVGLFLSASLANAAQISPLVTAALEFGGEELVNITYTDGSNLIS